MADFQTIERAANWQRCFAPRRRRRWRRFHPVRYISTLHLWRSSHDILSPLIGRPTRRFGIVLWVAGLAQAWSGLEGERRGERYHHDQRPAALHQKTVVRSASSRWMHMHIVPRRKRDARQEQVAMKATSRRSTRCGRHLLSIRKSRSPTMRIHPKIPNCVPSTPAMMRWLAVLTPTSPFPCLFAYRRGHPPRGESCSSSRSSSSTSASLLLDSSRRSRSAHFSSTRPGRLVAV
ncbi:hypothetical protein DFH08DRAFT_318201 [Mycena albidolilacea]|uniref:Uncharacterized protein n=1 Tax=Mycena albidolilacea TaxID=1033008 RepID=A0AAD7EJ24_9AGAR|nr:hypothetical protein DFH08DRAFT_318201 [Mycena albidolilacea]